MVTLKDIWISKGLNSTQVAAAADCSVPLLYRLNHKRGKEDRVAFGTVRNVCRVLGISLNDFDSLEPCPYADKYGKRGKAHK